MLQLDIVLASFGSLLHIALLSTLGISLLDMTRGTPGIATFALTLFIYFIYDSSCYCHTSVASVTRGDYVTAAAGSFIGFRSNHKWYQNRSFAGGYFISTTTLRQFIVLRGKIINYYYYLKVWRISYSLATISYQEISYRA